MFARFYGSYPDRNIPFIDMINSIKYALSLENQNER